MDRLVYGPYLMLLPPEKLAVITISEALNLTMYQVRGWRGPFALPHFPGAAPRIPGVCTLTCVCALGVVPPPLHCRAELPPCPGLRQPSAPPCKRRCRCGQRFCRQSEACVPAAQGNPSPPPRVL